MVIKGGKYDKKVDRFVIVFDRDSYRTPDEYSNFIGLAGANNLLVVTSPCFELWLILHYENAMAKYISPNKNKLFANKKASNKHTCASELFSKISGCNPKSGRFFNRIKDGIDLAVE